MLDDSVPAALPPRGAPLVRWRPTNPILLSHERPPLVDKAIDAVLKDIPE
jgi:hypothetical protein